MGLDFRGAEVSYQDAAHWSYSGFNRFRGRLPMPQDEDDALIILLAHPDSYGELTAEECAAIAPRLRAAIQDWDEDYDKEHALRLARHMEACAAAGEPLVFC